MGIIDKMIIEKFGSGLFIKYVKIPKISVFNREIIKNFKIQTSRAGMGQLRPVWEF